MEIVRLIGRASLVLALPALVVFAAPGPTPGWAGVALPRLATDPPGVTTGAGDWPMYGHDPARTNYNPAETAIAADTVGQLTPQWQAYIGSNGTAPSSAPSVAGGRVYVGSSARSGDNFFAFDATSGAPAWSTNVGYIEVGCFNIGIGATPAVAGDLVVAGGGDKAYYGLDANSGAHRWRAPLNAGNGFPWASPLIVDGRAYLGISSRCDDPSVRGGIRAVDLATGSELVSRYFVPAGQAGAGIWNSPALSPDGATLVVATGEDYAGYNGPYNRAIITLDPANLNILQANQQGATGRDLDFGTTPVIFHDRQGRALVGANHKNGVFYAFRLDAVDAGPLWSRAIGTVVGMMPAYDPATGDGGTLFIAGSGGQLYAVDPASGADRWGPVTIGTPRGNLAVANGLIFANLGPGGVKVLDATQGTVLRTLTPNHAGAANSGVVVANGFLYWQAGAYLNAWRVPPGSAATPPPAPGSPSFADPAFARVWTRTDSLVASHAASRSWLWGPAPNSGGLTEPYREGPGGQRLVQYFDKSRMEINHPAADPTQPFYVSNGLLVVELISGRIQVGDSSYEGHPPAALNVAGDAADATAPTYESFAGVANTTLGDHKAPDRTGQAATATLSRAGAVGDDPGKRQYANIDFVHYEPGVGHNIPRVFWDFLNQQGPVVENGQTVAGPLSSPWFYASGLPISEPYWATVKVAGVPRDVLIQAYERRVLTYNPANTPAFQVEMGNVGAHYYIWRYAGAAR